VPKQVVQQRDFSVLEIHPNFLEADDIQVRAQSLRGAYNATLNNARSVTGRPGTVYSQNLSGAKVQFQVIAGDGNKFNVVMADDHCWVVEEDESLNLDTGTVNWTSAEDVWFAPAGNVVFMGDDTNGIWTLEYDGSTWAFGTYTFADGAAGSLLQPYWNFLAGSAITPSARTGSITVTSDAAVFTSDHVGTRIRYAGKEIEITAFTDSQTVTGDVVSQLPPSFQIEVADTSEINVDDVVIGQVSGWRGVVTEVVDGTDFKAITSAAGDGQGTEYGGPTGTESLSFPNTTQDRVASSSITPEATKVWDEQMFSDARGYPRAGAYVSGRLMFSNMPEVPNGIVISSLRGSTDFLTGVEDDDAIIRTLGPSSARFLHIIESQDVILMSSDGIYVIELREGLSLTPSSFNPILVDKTVGVSSAKPVAVQDGVVFVEENQSNISALLLDGNIYLKWSVRPISLLSSETISAVTALGVVLADTYTKPNRIFASNGESMVVGHWFGRFGEQQVGFSPWETEGAIKSVIGFNGSPWGLIERDVTGSGVVMFERFDEGATMDCTTTGNPNTASVSDYLDGQTLGLVQDRRYAGAGLASGGIIEGFPDLDGDCEIGIPFTAEFALWPSEVIEHPRAGIFPVRCFRLIVSARHDCAFQIRCNSHTRTVGGFRFGEDLSGIPDPDWPSFGGDFSTGGYDQTGLADSIFRVPVTGRREHNDIAIILHIPGRVTIMTANQEVRY
jgi:hypothetical protein